jgi:acyl transferase domain-containing protein
VQGRAAADPEQEFQALLSQTVRAEGIAPASGVVLCLISTAAGLCKELQQAAKGVRRSVDTGTDWSSVGGSYFTPQPLASDRVAFVFGDGDAPYAGLGRQLHRVFPGLCEVVHAKTTDMWAMSDAAWNVREVVDTIARAEDASPQVDKFHSGVFHSVCFTALAQQVLGVQPKAACGLSLGERLCCSPSRTPSPADPTR